MNLKKIFLIRPKNNFKAIDGIRAIAVLWVIIFHIWIFQHNTFPNILGEVAQNPLLVWITKGDLGVDLFFVISGFLIGSILFKEYKRTKTLNFKSFYLRRFLRLFPVYFFSMIIALYFLDGNGAERWTTAWSNLIYVNNYVFKSYMGWTWSLAIEEQFYIVIPFLIVFLFPKFRKKRVLFTILAIIPIVLTYYYSVHIFNFEIPYNREIFGDIWQEWFWGYYMLTHLRYGGLLSGVIAAYIHINHSEQVLNFFQNKKNLSNFLILFSIVSFLLISSLSLGQAAPVEESIFYELPRNVGVYYEIIHRELFSYVVVFLMMACLYSKSRIIQPLNTFLSASFFYPIAKISYSAYLFHVMFMEWFFPIFTEYSKNSLTTIQIVFTNGVISIMVTILVAGLMLVFIEEPFNKLKNKLTS
ncbi:acyltransferase [Flavobacteriaceae bacterium]|nr:acyltransferase [Flavobacteriaceae bacterium]